MFSSKAWLLCLYALFSSVLANPYIWCEPTDRRKHYPMNASLTASNHYYFEEFFDWRVQTITQHVGDAVYDIQEALWGRSPALASQFQEVLGDDAYLTKLQTLKGHLDLGSSILQQGTSQLDVKTWLSGWGNGGVVC